MNDWKGHFSKKVFGLYALMATLFLLLAILLPVLGTLTLGLSLGLGAAMVSLVLGTVIVMVTRDSLQKQKSPAREDLWLLLPVAALIGVFLVEKAEFKIHHDETAIATMAIHLSEFGTPQVITRAYDLEKEGYLVLDNQMDKRPPLYPFLVSILHRSLGFHPDHPFWVNRGLAVLGLALLVLTLRHRFGSVTAAIASTFLVLVPQWCASAHSGGLEMLFLSLWVVFLVVIFNQGYQTGKGRLLLLLSALGMAWTRYEGLAVVAVVLLLIGSCESWRPSKGKWKFILPIFTCFTLIMLLPLALLHRISTAESWRWEEPQIFSPGFLPENLFNALVYFFFPTEGTTALPWLSFLVLFVLILFFITARRLPKAASFIWGGLPLLGMTLVIFSFFHGDLAHPITSRLSLPFWLFMTAVLSWAISPYMRKQPSAAFMGFTFIVAIGFLRFHDPLAYRQHNSQLLIQEAKRKMLEKWVGPPQPGIFIADQPSLLAISLGYGALNWEIRPGFVQRLALDSSQNRLTNAYLIYQSRSPHIDWSRQETFIDLRGTIPNPLEVRQVGNTFIHLYSLEFPTAKKGRGERISPNGIPYWIIDLP